MFCHAESISTPVSLDAFSTTANKLHVFAHEDLSRVNWMLKILITPIPAIVPKPSSYQFLWPEPV